MDHASHVTDLETPCLECHRSVLGSEQSSDRNLPNHIPCQECHISEDPSDIECSECHGKARAGGPDPSLVPPPRLHFSHRGHLAMLLEVEPESLPDVRPYGPLREQVYGEFVKAFALPPEVTRFVVGDPLCLSCHPNAKDAGIEHRVQLPSMQEHCLDCHDDQQAPRRCSLCHPEAPDAPLREGGVGWGELGLLPRSHGPLWLDDHRDEARIARADCEGCHRPGDCVRCHEGRVRPDYHPANWLLSHGLSSRYAIRECSVCHRRDECRGCHERRRVGMDTFPGSWQTIFHPPGWMTQRTPRFHGVAGRRNLLSCVSCHRQADCTGGGCH